ncbi:MAG: JAB domain-containing protein, partial [Bacteroidota bacterium]
EQFWIMLLDRANQVIRTEQVSSGGVSGTVVDARMIFKSAITHLASSVILVHNHPSGQLKPSHQDTVLTKKLIEAGRTLDVPVLDHIIFSDHGYFSFTDESMI